MTSTTHIGSRASARPKAAPLWPVALTVGLLAGAVGGAAQVSTVALLVVVALMQVVLLVGGLAVAHPPSPWGGAAIAIATSAAADLFAAFGRPAALSSLAAVVAFAVLATVVVQLSRGVARARVTEAMAACLGVALGAVSAATLLVLLRQHGGREAVTAAVLAAAVAVLTARCVDRVLPVPRVSPGIERGGLGIVLGSMAGAAAAAGYASTATPATPLTAALVGWSVALVAVLSDLAACYALVTAPARSAYTFAAGPLVALTAAAPVAYLLALMVVG